MPQVLRFQPHHGSVVVESVYGRRCEVSLPVDDYDVFAERKFVPVQDRTAEGPPGRGDCRVARRLGSGHVSGSVGGSSGGSACR